MMDNHRRPSAAEQAAARVALADMVAAKIVGGKATRTERETIACAIALHAGEGFASDKAAKRLFGVKASTNVRKLWLPRLRQLDAWHCGPPEVLLADGTDGDRPPPVEKFRCRHEPSCASAAAHKALRLRVAAQRKERWRRAHRPPPRVELPPPPSPPTPPPPPPPPRCQGTTSKGAPCRVHAGLGVTAAAPLKSGSALCAHHARDKFTGTQCAGITKRGVRCRVFSGSLYDAAAPLRDGNELCTVHLAQRHERVRCQGKTRGGRGDRCRITSWTPYPDAAPLRHGKRFCEAHAHQECDLVRCAGVTRKGELCTITSWNDHAGAQPLRHGERYCARHAAQAEQAEQQMTAAARATTSGSYVPEGTVCAACRGADDLSKDPSDEDGAWYCQSCWDAWERDDPLAAVWSMVMFGGVCE